MIKLYDISAMLYIGNSVDRPGDDFISEKLNGLPVKGLRYTLEHLISDSQVTSDEIIAVMDSPTNKKEHYNDYKSNRTFNNEVFVQRELLRYLIPNLGINMLSQKEFEADDLFYCFVLDMFTKKKIPFDGINLYCDDLDLAGCIVYKSIYRMGLTSKTPMLTCDNYSYILHRHGMSIPYNAVLPFIMFYGKPSNNLKVFKSADHKECFNAFMQFANENFKGKENLFSLELVMRKFLEYCQASGLYNEAFFNEVEERIPVVYPRLGWNKDVALIKQKLDKRIATDFLTLLDEKRLLSMLHLKPVSEDSVSKTLLDKWVSIYRSGTTSVDNYVTADSTFFFEGDTHGNVGGF